MITQSMIDKYRYANTEDSDWDDAVEQDFRSRMEDMGVSVDKIYCTLSYSQGDGACFSGGTGTIGVKKFCEKHPTLLKDYPVISKLFYEHEASFGVEIYINHSRYTHSNSMRVSSHSNSMRVSMHIDSPTDCLPYDPDDESDLRTIVVNQLEDLFHDEFIRLEKELLDLMRGYADELYESLQEEYEYLTSDEAVIEYIKSNHILLAEIN